MFPARFAIMCSDGFRSGRKLATSFSFDRAVWPNGVDMVGPDHIEFFSKPDRYIGLPVLGPPTNLQSVLADTLARNPATSP